MKVCVEKKIFSSIGVAVGSGNKRRTKLYCSKNTPPIWYWHLSLYGPVLNGCRLKRKVNKSRIFCERAVEGNDLRFVKNDRRNEFIDSTKLVVQYLYSPRELRCL
jgi:hypothetical protein